MSARLKQPIYSPADRLGDKLHSDEGHGRAHCRGELGRQQCTQRSACALHVRWLQEPRAKCLTLPRVGVNPCRYFREVAR